MGTSLDIWCTKFSFLLLHIYTIWNIYIYIHLSVTKLENKMIYLYRQPFLVFHGNIVWSYKKGMIMPAGATGHTFILVSVINSVIWYLLQRKLRKIIITRHSHFLFLVRTFSSKFSTEIKYNNIKGNKITCSYLEV